MCLRKMFAIPTLKDRSSGTCLVISDVIRWQPLDGAVTVMVRCAHPAVPVTICTISGGRQQFSVLRQTCRNKRFNDSNLAPLCAAVIAMCAHACGKAVSTHRLLLIYRRQRASLPSPPHHALPVGLLRVSAGARSVGWTCNWRWLLEAMYRKGAQTGQLGQRHRKPYIHEQCR